MQISIKIMFLQILSPIKKCKFFTNFSNCKTLNFYKIHTQYHFKSNNSGGAFKEIIFNFFLKFNCPNKT